MAENRALRLCYAGWADHVHLERWASFFANEQHDVSVVSFSGPGHYPAGVHQANVGLRNRGPYLKKLKLRWILRRLRPQLLHVHWAHFGPLFLDIWKGPLVVTAWGSDIYRIGELSKDIHADLSRTLSRADLITGDSADLLAETCRLFPQCTGKVELIQWGVDTDLFRPNAGQGRLAAELGIIGRPIVFSARNFTPLYNQDIVVRAFAEIRSQTPDAVLVMKNYGGQADYIQSIRALIASLDLDDAVRILDSMPYESMPELYAMADVTVSVPSTDATPMALLEAMACGSVPIFSDLPSLRQWINTGKNGFLVPPRDTAALATAIRLALANRISRQEMAAENRRLVESTGSQRFWMGKMEQIYRELAERTPR